MLLALEGILGQIPLLNYNSRRFVSIADVELQSRMCVAPRDENIGPV